MNSFKLSVISSLLTINLLIPILSEANTVDEDKEYEKWTVGAVYSYSSSPYKSYDHQNQVFPLVNYNDRQFYIRGTEGGIKFLVTDHYEASIGLSYSGFEFNPKDTTNLQLKQLDKRKSTVTLDANFLYKSSLGFTRFKGSVDVLDRSNGLEVDLSHRYPVVKKESTQVLAGAGIKWNDAKYNDYYYGISSHESAHSGLSPYKASNEFTPYIVIEARYNFSKRLSAVAAGRLTFLNSEVKNSPMTDDSTKASVGIGIEYNF